MFFTPNQRVKSQLRSGPCCSPYDFATPSVDVQADIDVSNLLGDTVARRQDGFFTEPPSCRQISEVDASKA
jgi:hypothetical protein